MASCQSCIYSYEGDWGFLYCRLLTNSGGGDLRVSKNGSCDHYSAISTASNSNYKSGSGSGSSGCFLTSACVEYLGKEDDCYELTTLRNFRDNEITKTSEGRILIKEYYTIAPIIVEKINNSKKMSQFYDYIYKQIQECIKYIQMQDNKNAIKIYYDMVQTLKKELL